MQYIFQINLARAHHILSENCVGVIGERVGESGRMRENICGGESENRREGLGLGIKFNPPHTHRRGTGTRGNLKINSKESQVGTRYTRALVIGYIIL